MARPRILILIGLLTALLAAPAASAHERYFSPDDQFVIVLGEQDEPVYTYDFTNLDLIVSDNATGARVTGVDGTLNATLISPTGEELSMPIEPQHGEEGRYEFVEGYLLTQPGQYKVQLEGTINGTDVTGEYLLPGPRSAFTEITFPHDDVQELRALAQENADLKAQIEDLESRLSELETDLAGMETGGQDEASANAPGFSVLAALAALGVLAVVRARRER